MHVSPGDVIVLQGGWLGKEKFECQITQTWVYRSEEEVVEKFMSRFEIEMRMAIHRAAHVVV